MPDFSNVIGESRAIRDVFNVMERVVQNSEVSVLIGGETGTGKEIVARAIHDNSATGSELFVEVNCSAIPEHLLESELFGYERGAFTGAERLKKGLFELADGGTLLLDEIGHMSVGLQAKLLKAIEEKTFRRLGGEKEVQVRVRIVAATNIDLAVAMQEGKFREDLFYRLNEIPIVLPPLRDRDDDVIVWPRTLLKSSPGSSALSLVRCLKNPKNCFESITGLGTSESFATLSNGPLS